MSMDFNTVKLWEASGGNVLAVRNSQGILWEPSSYTKSGVSPLSYIGNGVPLIDLIISGNMNQSGTPTPTTPIQPQECGERTGNLAETVQGGIDATNGMDSRYSDTISQIRTQYIPCDENADYNLTANIFSAQCFIAYYDENQDYISRTTASELNSNRGFTTPVNCAYLRATLYHASNTEQKYPYTDGVKIMISKGSTALPYEPYGYKLDISSGDTTTPVYLGEVETERKIKKLVLDGTEDWRAYGSNNAYRVDTASIGMTDRLSGESGYCTHYVRVSSTSLLENGTFAFGSSYFYICDTNCETYSALKTFLQQQYANGTPVCVWYILATPTTAVVNEPLRKIGDYADTLSLPKSTVPIPTVLGNNALTVDTSLPPSSVSVTVGETQWERFRRIVRAGLGPIFYPVGTKLFKVWRDTTSEALIVGGYDVYFDETLTAQGYTHSVLLMEEKLTPSLQADAVEAMMYVETAMPPGTYKFTIPDYDSSYGGNKTYYFETTQTVPVGGQICLEWRYQTVPRTIRTYASSTSTTVLDSYGTSANPLPEWIDGTSPPAVDLGTVSVSTSVTTGSYGTFNHIHRARYGSNNYYQSKLRQYINADVASNWWTPMTIFDRPMDFYSYGPNPASASGYLYSQPADFASVLATPTVPCYTNSTFEYGNGPDGTAFTRNTAYNVKDKLFLLSHTEVNLTSGTPAVGSVLPYYTGAADAKRIKYRKDNNSAADWWFRVPYPSFGNNFRYCNSSGALYRGSAYNAYGLAAACVIQ